MQFYLQQSITNRPLELLVLAIRATQCTNLFQQQIWKIDWIGYTNPSCLLLNSNMSEHMVHLLIEQYITHQKNVAKRQTVSWLLRSKLIASVEDKVIPLQYLSMILDEYFEEYIRLCIRILERMGGEDDWPDVFVPDISVEEKKQLPIKNKQYDFNQPE